MPDLQCLLYYCQRHIGQEQNAVVILNPISWDLTATSQLGAVGLIFKRKSKNMNRSYL